jgi:hypothetical protein
MCKVHFEVFVKLPPTVCIAEVRIFDAASDRNCSKIEKQKTKNEQMLTDVRLPGQLMVSD